MDLSRVLVTAMRSAKIYGFAASNLLKLFSARVEASDVRSFVHSENYNEILRFGETFSWSDLEWGYLAF